jgi:hypothetical protein
MLPRVPGEGRRTRGWWPPGHIEEVLDRQRDAVKRREVAGRGGPHHRIGSGGRGVADVVVGPVAEWVEPRVELVHPLEVAIGHLDRAHSLRCMAAASSTTGGERVNRVAFHDLSFLPGC